MQCIIQAWRRGRWRYIGWNLGQCNLLVNSYVNDLSYQGCQNKWKPTTNVQPMLSWYWASVVDGGPRLIQNSHAWGGKPCRWYAPKKKCVCVCVCVGGRVGNGALLDGTPVWSTSCVISIQTTQWADPLLIWCWATVVYAGPTSNQRWTTSDSIYSSLMVS